MDGLELVQTARKAGLQVWLEGDSLKIKGPRRLSAMATMILENKQAVIATLVALVPSSACISGNPLSADAGTRPVKPGENGASVNSEQRKSGIGCGPLHVQPGRWERQGGRATCPNCGRFMGYVRTNGGQDET